MSVLRELLSEASTISVTKLVFLVIGLTVCSPLWAWTVMFVWYAWSPDIPGNVIVAQGGLISVIAGLVGWQHMQMQATKQQEIKTAAGTEKMSVMESRSGKESARSTEIESSGPTPK